MDIISQAYSVVKAQRAEKFFLHVSIPVSIHVSVRQGDGFG